MSEQNQNPDLSQLPAPPELSQLPPPPQEAVEASQGRFREFLSNTNARYDAWLDRQVERNPGKNKAEINYMTGIVGGVAVLAAYKLGPAYAEHLASAVTKSSTEVGDKVLDGAAFSLTTGLAFGAGMNYLDRRKARKQANQ